MNETRLVRQAYDNACEKYTVMGTFLYGSQNYLMSTENSDVDVKTLVVPTMKQLVLGQTVKSNTVDLGFGLNDVKDFREMFKNYRKGNVNFLETLYTDHFVMHEDYVDVLRKLRQNRELVTHCNPTRTLRSMAGMAYQKYTAFEKPFESKKEVLAKYGYDPKQLHHTCRLALAMEVWVNTLDFQRTLHLEKADREWLMTLKTNPLPYENAKELLNKTMVKVDKYREYTLDVNKEREVDDFFTELTFETFGLGGIE